jgi:hypothetical protein
VNATAYSQTGCSDLASAPELCPCGAPAAATSPPAFVNKPSPFSNCYLIPLLLNLTDTTHQASLRPLGKNDYDWHPERSASGPITMVVARQIGRFYIYRDGNPAGRAAVEIDGCGALGHLCSRRSKGRPAA